MAKIPMKHVATIVTSRDHGGSIIHYCLIQGESESVEDYCAGQACDDELVGITKIEVTQDVATTIWPILVLLHSVARDDLSLQVCGLISDVFQAGFEKGTGGKSHA